MHDWRDELEMGPDGKLRRKRVARDRERITFATISDHAAYGFSPTFSDGSPDHTSPHRPGFRFADTADAGKIAANEAYEARSRRLESGWQRKGEQHDAFAEESAPPRLASLDELRAKANQEYENRSRRLADAWRRRDA